MDTYAQPGEYVNISNIPVNKWLHVCIRCQGQVVDTFVNGIIAQSMVLSNVPKQNNGNVYVGSRAASAFLGYISNLWYFSKSLSVADIQSLASQGPNTTAYAPDVAGTKAVHLSSRWYSPLG